MPLDPVEPPGKIFENADYTAANGDLILKMFLDSAREGSLEVVQPFVVGDVSVNIVGDGGWTALHHAAYGGHLAVVKYLVEHGADVNAKSNDGATALHWAVVGGGGHLAVVKYLVEHGADVNATHNRGFTARDEAVEKDHTVVEAYLESVGGAFCFFRW